MARRTRLKRSKGISTYMRVMRSLAVSQMPRLKRGTLQGMTVNNRSSILEQASMILFEKSYGDLDDYDKEKVWVALEGELK